MNWAAIRAEFPILQQEVNGCPLIYFDNAATSQKPRCVIEAITRYYERDNANVHRGLHTLSHRATVQYEAAREKMARYFGAGDAEEIVFTRGATEGINLVGQGWMATRLGPEDEILITEMEHHSNIVPWQMAAARSGALLKYVRLLDDGTLDLESAREALSTGRVKVMASTHISNSLGTINPVSELCSMARAAGALSMVDGAQSVGQRPVDVVDLGCDFFVFSGHKMGAPTGIGGVWARKALLTEMPPWQGGGEMIRTVRMDGCEYKSGPARFEAGTPPIAEAVGLGAAIDFIEQIGREAIWEHDQELVTAAREVMEALPGVKILGPPAGVERGALLSFHLEAAHPHDLVTVADEQGLALRAGHHCTQPVMRRFRVPSTTRANLP